MSTGYGTERLTGSADFFYEPCQPGYASAGRRYAEQGYSSDCRLGQYLCGMFQVGEPGPGPIRVITDGCNDILVTWDGRRVRSWLSPSIPAACSFHYGEVQWIFGVRFLPGATYALFHRELEYSIRSRVELGRLFRDISRIGQPLCKALSFARRREIVEDYLAGQLARRPGGEQILSRCVAQIIRSDGLIPVQELAEESGYSVRYLRQLFVQHVGHSPKELAMIVRMQRALRWIWEHPGDSLGETAARFGFADQSHMNREFRRFLGVTSGAVQGDTEWIARLRPDFNRNF